MIFETRKKICFLANTKTGSSTIERWVPQGFHQVRFNNVPYKHADYRKFVRFCRIFDVDPKKIETVCVVRHPFDKLQSWYKYRMRPEIQDPNHPKHANSLAGTTFEEFVTKQIGRAEAGEQVGLFCDRYFVEDDTGEVAVSRIYRYDDIDACIAYLQKRFQIEERPKRRNVSPPADLTLSEQTKDRFDTVFADHIAWYERLPRFAAPAPKAASERSEAENADAAAAGEKTP